MKTMTCKQLGGACDEKFTAETFEEIAELSQKHGTLMFQKGDKPHLEAMAKMQEVILAPGGMENWMEAKRIEFDKLGHADHS